MFDVILAGKSLSFTYDANVAIQSGWFLNWDIGRVVFTIVTSEDFYSENSVDMVSTGVDNKIEQIDVLENVSETIELTVSETQFLTENE